MSDIIIKFNRMENEIGWLCPNCELKGGLPYFFRKNEKSNLIEHLKDHKKTNSYEYFIESLE